MSLEELKADVAEWDSLLAQARRPTVRAVIEKEADRLRAALYHKEKEESASKASSTPSASTATSARGLPIVKITNYGWDQSDKFVKLYVTLPGAQNAKPEDVQCNFTGNSFVLSVVLGGKRYEFVCRDLLEDIVVDNSTAKQKTDMILIMAKKAREARKWEYLTKTEQMAKEKSKPKFDAKADDQDPQAGLMGLMKQMYDEGDDEMKRTIRKSWHESQSKKGAGGDMGGMGGLGDF